ncbi:MAG: exodeoxyribonuclease VII small subunit [Chitinophagales bacterium]
MTTYNKSLTELQQIVVDLENESIGVDELSEKVKRASELIQFCQQKLRSTETAISETLGNSQEV